MRALAVILLGFLGACVAPAPGPGPAPVEPSPEPVADAGAYDCDSAAANLASLGGCGVPMDGFVTRCRDTAQAESRLGIVLPVACLSVATTCAQVEACR